MATTVSKSQPLQLGALLADEVGDSQVDPNSAVVLPQGVERRVRNAVAELWSVPAESVTVRWGSIAYLDSLDDETEFRLIGRGLDSWFAVVFERPGQPAFAARMRAGWNRRIVVAARALTPGQVLSAEDLTTATQVTWGPPQPGDTMEAKPGWHVKGAIAAGGPVAEPFAVPAPVIRSGDRVRLTWQRGVVTVALEGVALHEAAVGQVVNVQLKGRRGTAKGKVMGPGRAVMSA